LNLFAQHKTNINTRLLSNDYLNLYVKDDVDVDDKNDDDVCVLLSKEEFQSKL